MKKIDYRKRRILPAWTLPELLLVMILTGLLFLSALDGLELLKRFMFRLQQERQHVYELQENWELLDRILVETDSVISGNHDFFLYRGGQEWMSLHREGQYLTCRKEEKTDTLFTSVTEVRLVRTEDKKQVGDSLFVMLTAEDQVYSFVFGLKPLLP